MPRGDKSKYTDKQERKADHIAQGYEARGVPEKEAERRAKRGIDAETPVPDGEASSPLKQTDLDHTLREDSGLQNVSSGKQVAQHSAEPEAEVLRFEQETEQND